MDESYSRIKCGRVYRTKKKVVYDNLQTILRHVVSKFHMIDEQCIINTGLNFDICRKFSSSYHDFIMITIKFKMK